MQDSMNYWVSTIYWLLLIVFGSLFVLNLALAVIENSYSNQADEQEEAVEAERKKLADEAARSGGAIEDDSSPADPEAAPPRAKGGWSCMRPFAESDGFGNFIMLMIIANTIQLALDSKPTAERCYTAPANYTAGMEQTEYCFDQAVEMSDEMNNALVLANYWFVIVFSWEMFVKLIG